MEVRETGIAHFGVLIVAAIVSVTFYSSFGSNWQGVLDSVTAYAHYFDKGAGGEGPHTHPWTFYLSRLGWHHLAPGPYWTEGFILFAAVLGATVATLGVRRIDRNEDGKTAAYRFFLASFAFGMAVAYSILPYKTPWNLVAFWVPMCVVGGMGLGWLWTRFRHRVLRVGFGVLVAIAAGHLTWLNVQSNFEYAEYPYNPYVYGHTSSAFQRLVDRIDNVSGDSSAGKSILVAVIQPDGDYWPLPWYLRTYDRVGYWTSIPEPLPPAAIFILDPKVAERLHERLSEDYQYETHGLRPAVLRAVYVKRKSE